MHVFVSIRFRLTALIAGVALALTWLTAVMMPRYVADAERRGLEERASAAAAMLASAVAPALDFQQADTAREVIAVANEDRLVEWVAAYDREGHRVVASGSGSLRHLKTVKEARLLQTDRTRIVAVAPAGTDQTTVGAVVVSLSAAGIGERERATRNAILLQSALVSALFIALALFIASRMASVIEKMKAAAIRIARGDLSHDITLSTSSDELGTMARAFVEMTLRLRELQQNAVRVAAGDLRVQQQGTGELFVAFRTMVENLRRLARNINDSSESVASAAAGLFSATREHEASATQQTASVEEMRRTLSTLASAAEHVNTDALQVRDMAQQSLNSSQQAADQTKLLSAHSERIGEILTLIQDIADKSDLLALNAALEGTRAGEVGRGFSLVAAEMRRLSEHVVDSVRDIRKLVADMRAASHSSVLATEESIKLAKEVAQSSGKITSAMGQQREGTGQVKGAADEIVRVVNASLDGTADITRSAEALLQLSHELKTSTSAFRLDAEA
jgi:methyl-accepting chemotaxis protein